MPPGLRKRGLLGNRIQVSQSRAYVIVCASPACRHHAEDAAHSHSFFDARNSLGFATLGASLTADALSTQKGLAYPGFHEMNPIARPFVQTRAGAAVYSAGSFGLIAGTMYWAHRKEHHKLERFLPFAVAGWKACSVLGITGRSRIGLGRHSMDIR